MTRHWTDRLSEYIDGDLSFTERVAVEKHLAECAACRETAAGLRGVAAAAASLPDLPPDRELWQAIADRIAPANAVVHHITRGPAAMRRRISFTVPQLLAASIALVMLSGSGVFLAVRGSSSGAAPLAGTPEGVRQVDTRNTESYYDVAIRDLEAALRQNRARLDPATVEVIEANIRIIDRAIFDARTALERDPSNMFLNQHLENTMKRKIELLKRATSMS